MAIVIRQFRAFREGLRHPLRALAVVVSGAVVATTAIFVGIAIPSSSAQATGQRSGLTQGLNGPKPTIVLVHGAWADASSWAGVIGILQAKGYTVDAPPNPLRGLSEDSGYLANYLRNISGPVVLVGHSYGGMVTTTAATGNPNVKALVYVDAFIPNEFQFLGELAGPNSCLGSAAAFQFVQDPALPPGDVDAYARTQSAFPYPGFQRCFAGGFPSWQASELAAAQRPIAVGAITDGSGPPAWASIPSWALVGTQDQAIPEAQQVAMATTAGSHISYFHAPHFGLISQPWKVAAVINQAVAATS
jgi:pimeloyl-ACP methyl ester carboxylesterase